MPRMWYIYLSILFHDLSPLKILKHLWTSFIFNCQFDLNNFMEQIWNWQLKTSGSFESSWSFFFNLIVNYVINKIIKKILNIDGTNPTRTPLNNLAVLTRRTNPKFNLIYMFDLWSIRANLLILTTNSCCFEQLFGLNLEFLTYG